MRPWVLRALVMAVVHAAVSTLVDSLSLYHPEAAGIVRPVALAVLVGVAAAWGGVDGWLRRPDAARTWFIAALVAGPAAGVLGVIAHALFVDQSGIAELGAA